jgi:hypothetical protein
LHAEDGDVSVVAFCNKNLVVFNLSENQEILKLPFGGGHRSWGKFAVSAVSFVNLSLSHACTHQTLCILATLRRALRLCTWQAMQSTSTHLKKPAALEGKNLLSDFSGLCFRFSLLFLRS